MLARYDAERESWGLPVVQVIFSNATVKFLLVSKFDEVSGEVHWYVKV